MMRYISLRSLLVLSGLISMIVAGAVFFARDQIAQDKQSPGIDGRFSKADRITDAIRDTENEFVSIAVWSESERESAKASGTVIADYGTEIVVARRKDASDGVTGLDERKLDTRINLPGKQFEPNEISTASGESAVSEGKDYYIVQFGAHVNDDWLDSLRDLGAEVIQYVPNQAFIVYADASAAESIRGHSRVRWTGRYRPEHKLSELGKERADSFGAVQAEFHIAVFKRSDLSVVHRQISSVPGIEILEVQEPPFGFFDLFAVRVSGEVVEGISKISDVFRIDPYEKPVAEDERAAQIVAGNYTNTTTIDAPGYDPLAQFGVDGTGVTVSISDDGVSIPGNGGFYITAANTVDGPLRGATAGSEGGHGHINASIVAGAAPFATLDPTNYNYGSGIAPGAHIINIPFLKAGNTTTNAQSVDDTVSTAGPNGVKGSIINNSWGSGTNSNSYDSFAALWDGFVFDASFAGTRDPINVIFSAGNSGVSGLTRPKMAKNVIAVGNSENLRTELGGSSADNIDDMRSSSSRGPAADGRVKPDITAPGTYISGARAGSLSGVWGAIDADHVYSGGTSHAAPQVAGVAALFTQFWKNNNGGQLPSPSLVKAAILNSGQEMNGFGSNTPLPNGDEGWGRVNMKLIFDSGTSTIYRNEANELSEPGMTSNVDGVVANASKPLRIALVWTDPPGTSDPALVNDLDLTVTVGGDVYKGNVFSAGVSETGGTGDNRNNVEIVRLPAGIATGTQVSIEVRSVALNGDGIPGNGDSTDQTFSLVAYNVSEQAAGSDAVFDFDGDGATDVSVFRPNSQPTAQWWLLRSSDQGTRGLAFGTSTDVPV
ncbi:MAG TPA: S8 family serine peptidase, partial [Aridibacter sp.]|nr:S8 family serine peptidase [Aridibacter sp.]